MMVQGPEINPCERNEVDNVALVKRTKKHITSTSRTPGGEVLHGPLVINSLLLLMLFVVVVADVLFDVVRNESSVV